MQRPGFLVSKLWTQNSRKVQGLFCLQKQLEKVNGGFIYQFFLVYSISFTSFTSFILGLFKQKEFGRCSKHSPSKIYECQATSFLAYPFSFTKTSTHNIQIHPPPPPPPPPKKKALQILPIKTCQDSGALHSPNGHPFNAKGSLSPLQGIASPIK